MKQHLKKLCGTFLALSMLLTLLPVTAFAADATIDLSTLSTTPSGSGWSYDSGTQMLAIGDSGSYNITGTYSGSSLGISAPNNGFQINGASFAVSSAGIQAGQSVQIKENSSVTGGGGIYVINSATNVSINGSTVSLSGSIYAVRAATSVLIGSSTVSLSSSIGPAVSAGEGIGISGGTVNLSSDSGPAVSAGTGITISGGTVSLSSVSGPAVSTGTDIIISGGSVNLSGASPLSARPQNGSSSPVYLVTLTGLSANKSVTAITSPASYGNVDVKTDSSGKLYFWLPTGFTNISLTVDNYTYTDSLTVAANDTNTLALGGDITASFTDANFLAAVRANLGKNDGDPIFVSDVAGITLLDVKYKGIASLAGIEHFTSLRILDCSGNKLTSLNVSGLSELTELYCFGNKLTSLSVANLSHLMSLTCSYNRLTSLTLTNLPNLATLNCNNNALESLDLQGTLNNLSKSNLQSLSCQYNRLTSLSIPSLTHSNVFTLNCSGNWMSNESDVTDLPNSDEEHFTFAPQAPGFISVQEILDLPTTVEVGVPLPLTGTVFPANASKSSNDIAFSISAMDSGTTGARIENNILTTSYAGTVQVQIIVVGGIAGIENYYQSFPIEITGTDLSFAFPDGNFLYGVRVALGKGYIPDAPVYQAELAQITQLDINNWGIGSLAGIEYLTGLQTLNCSGNNLTSLDLSSLSALQTLNCGNNDLTSLVLSGLSNLTTLNCYGNDLASLNASSLSALQTLNCVSNNLTSLDLSGLSALQTLNCNDNSLPSLVLSGLSALQTLNCNDNSLPSLDLSGLSALQTLNCSLNNLTSLDVTGLSALKNLYCTFNYLPSTAALIGYDSAVTTSLLFDPQSPLPGSHSATVAGSYAVLAGGGSYLPGVTVSIDAGSRSGYTFFGWSSSNGMSFANAASAATTFVMPDQDITVTASWTANGGGGNGGGSGGGASSTPAPTTSGSTATTTVTPTVKNGAATASVPASQVTSALEQAQKAAKASGETPKVEIKLANTSGVSSAAATIPQESVKSLVSGNVSGLTVSSSLGSVTFDAASLAAISGAVSGNVTVSTARVDPSALPAAVQALVGSRPVYEFTVTSGGKTVSQFGGTVAVSVPYTLGAGEDPNAVIVSYLNASGNLETVLSGRYDVASGTVTFTTTHFSKYSVGYNKVTFADVSDGAWYADAVTYLAARGVTGGTTDTTFTPDATLTRGQFITLLLKAYGIEAIDGAADNFADAGSTYYTGYLAAAKQLGITSGVGNNSFAPTQTISRQQMFTLLYNALNALGQLPEGDSGKALTDFADSGSVAPYAQKAMAYLVEAGVVGGKNGYLLPQSSSTRAQMAQVLYNLLRK
ncbi:S-layer homology domain-containing protein [Oscillibacter sp.]|uniref:S-layer homology domain-containing protein n=1 Tax=Oscillibacter sp. TaxID=1945593 RepID=UPI00289C9D92|nr:S-layer homology domain-containing protein [Oscillibacter sp.]